MNLFVGPAEQPRAMERNHARRLREQPQRRRVRVHLRKLPFVDRLANIVAKKNEGRFRDLSHRLTLLGLARQWASEKHQLEVGASFERE